MNIYAHYKYNTRPRTPHVHAQYGEYELSISFDGNIIEGNLLNKQRKLVEAWVALHEDELKAAWKAYNESGEIIKIKGMQQGYASKA